MSVGYHIWLPFGDLLHDEESVKDPFFSASPGDEAWWVHRAEILERYTLPSLRAQGGTVWAGIAQETRQIAKPVVAILKDAGVRVVYHPARDARHHVRGQAPVAAAILSAHEAGDEASVWLFMDSDDMLLRGAMESVRTQPVDPGRVCWFASGYILNTHTGQLCEYLPGGCPAPFFARTYTPEAWKNLEEYEERWGYHNVHWQLPQNANTDVLPAGKYVVLVHDRNTTTTWEVMWAKDRLGREVEGVEKEKVLSGCGL